MKTKNTLYTLCLFLMLTIGFSSLAATSNNQITFPDDVDDEAPVAPIDGFVVVGIAVGAILGSRKHPKNKM